MIVNKKQKWRHSNSKKYDDAERLNWYLKKYNFLSNSYKISRNE